MYYADVACEQLTAWVGGFHWWSLRAFAVTLSISESASLSQHQTTVSFFQSHLHTTKEKSTCNKLKTRN